MWATAAEGSASAEATPSGGEDASVWGTAAEGSASDEAEPSGGEDERGQKKGLIVGRFCPPHLGHSFMIDAAAAKVDQLVVMVNTRDGEPIALRAANRTLMLEPTNRTARDIQARVTASSK